jgi:hypothetical protein
MVTPRTRLLQQLNKQATGGGLNGSLDSSSEAPWGEAAAGEEEAGSCAGSAASGGGVLEYRCAKFHLVDLAGSERTKRSGVVGVRFREAVTINQVGVSCLPPMGGGQVVYRKGSMERVRTGLLVLAIEAMLGAVAFHHGK